VVHLLHQRFRDVARLAQGAHTLGSLVDHDVGAAGLAIGQLAGRRAEKALLRTGVRLQFHLRHQNILLTRITGFQGHGAPARRR